MKTIALIALVAITFSSHAIQFSCSNSDQNSPEGLVALSGRLNDQNGKIELTGDGIYSRGSKREVVTFFRNQRQDETKYTFAKFTGGSLFHLFYFSVPKKALNGGQENFTGYLNFLREGVGGMAQHQLACKLTTNNEIMLEITGRLSNMVNFERLEEEGFGDIIESVANYNDLPLRIQNTLKRLRLSILADWDVIEEGTSQYVINFSNEKYESDAIKVVVEGKTQGYVFNVTECNIEECYGWDALYLNADGIILEQSF